MTNTTSSIDRIQPKLAQLRRAGIRYTQFSGQPIEPYWYELKLPLSQAEIELFEREHSISLPLDYREFLLQVGDGGTGPHSGLYQLTTQMGRYFTGIEGYGRGAYPERLHQPFPLTDSLILYKECAPDQRFATWLYRYRDGKDDEARRMEERAEKFNAPVYSHGTLELCHFGCGIFFFLVVCGPEYGNMWVDDRTNGEGIFPLRASSTDSSRIGFLQWYEQWLDHALGEITEGHHVRGPYHFWPNYWWVELVNEAAHSTVSHQDQLPPDVGEPPF